MKLVVACVILFFSSWAPVALSQGGSGGKLPCLTKLMPCVSFFHSAAEPTGACCIPLKDALEKEVPCLCRLFGDESLQQRFNVTQDDLLGLPPRCGLQSPDLGKCGNTRSAASSGSSRLGIGMSMILLILGGTYSVTSVL
ncbi:non-specific lipid-transfer protein-like protein [Canna indica]|uniref:Non-specific lipid-transfer protein-like protein n=1 Tax=Canna indica TaxID=4628 RepID=A0AAQ3JW68_9LILI|nr:non-specific lipid-transfer protein-like protein [Canna indica]